MAELSRAYTVVSGTSEYERMFYLFHRLGIQSNLIVSATYASRDGGKLTKAALTAALRVVVEAHPRLRLVFVSRPGAQRGRHDLHTAVLSTIDLDTCVEYVDDDSGAGVTPEVLEGAHNRWDWTDDDPKTPWWKVIVVGMRHVVLVFHHSLFDGLSGTVFHRELLAVLNSADSSTEKGETRLSSIIHADPANIKLPPEPLSVCDIKPTSMWVFVWRFLAFISLGLVTRYLLFDDLPKVRPYLASPTAVADASQRMVTRVSTVRIPEDKMKRIIAACREHKTTFTPLLLTAFTMTLASDFYPRAKLGLGRISLELRPLLPRLTQAQTSNCGMMTMAGCSATEWLWLAPFRAADGRGEAGKKMEATLDVEAVWRLVREQKSFINTASMKSARDWVAGDQIGSDLDYYADKTLGRLGPLLGRTFMVSNLGAFSVERAGDDLTATASSRRWAVDEMQFSCGMTNGNQGSHGFVFSACGVQGGGTVINANYAEGVVSREMAQAVLEGAVARLEALLDG